MRHLLILCLLSACGTAPDGEDATDGEGTPSERAGLYELAISVTPFGGLLVRFQAEIEAEVGDEGEVLTRFSLRAADGDTVSDVLARDRNIAVGEDGTFSVSLDSFTLPGDFAPLGSDIDLYATLDARFTDDGFCGDASGEIESFGVDLGASTVGARRWEDRDDGALVASCDGPPPELPRIEDCPALAAGRNDLFPSGGLDRSFELVLPPEDAVGPHPVLFAWHGFGGDAASFLSPGLEDAAASQGMILIVPEGLDRGGVPGFDVVSPPATNTDLALFDDVLTCVSEQFDVDPERVHTTGMSNGGLMSGYLLATRAERLASVAPLSGGITVDATPAAFPPTLLVWGGPTDEAYDQDFHALAGDAITTLRAADTFVVACEHTDGHALSSGWWAWVVDFLAAHPRDAPAPAWAGGLPESVPDWCVIAP